jgi:hypothetical protein
VEYFEKNILLIKGIVKRWFIQKLDGSLINKNLEREFISKKEAQDQGWIVDAVVIKIFSDNLEKP